MVDRDPHGIQRRVIGDHHFRMDGLNDLLLRAPGASVLSLGCNRGNECLKMADWGASLIHGVDNHDRGIMACKEFFADLRSVESKFEVVDLTHGAKMLELFGETHWDIVLCLATYHKIKRAMPGTRLSVLMKEVGKRTKQYFAWRGTKDDHEANDEEIKQLDRDLGEVGLKRIHTSYIATELGATAIWARN